MRKFDKLCEAVVKKYLNEENDDIGETTDELEIPEKEDDTYEQCSMIVYQKKNGGDWERVEIPYKRKKI